RVVLVHVEELLAQNGELRLHLLPVPGQILGLSPIAYFATTTEAGLLANQFGRDWFANGSTPSAVLETDMAVDQGAATVLKARFKEAAQGRDVVALGNGVKYRAISVPANESQFLETIKATANQVAAIYGVPPEKVGGETGGSLTYATVEQNSIDLLTWTLLSGQLVDVAPVNDPAYLDTSTGLRSLAEKAGAELAEVRAAAEAGELKRFLGAPAPTIIPPGGQGDTHPLVAVRQRRAELVKRRTF
ncbi:phage portal protein, partial [Leucobacter chromiiresistens]